MEADAYLQKLASYIRDNAKRLGAPPFGRPTSTSLFSPTQLKPLSLRLTPRNLYYILLRFQAIGLDVGSLEVKIEVDARRAISLIEPLASSHGGSDRSETGSFRSMASSAVSSLGLGGWWGASNNDPGTFSICGSLWEDGDGVANAGSSSCRYDAQAHLLRFHEAALPGRTRRSARGRDDFGDGVNRTSRLLRAFEGVSQPPTVRRFSCPGAVPRSGAVDQSHALIDWRSTRYLRLSFLSLHHPFFDR